MQKKHKILHIITRFMKSGGAERNTYFTIKGLNKEKYDVDLVIGGESEMVPEDLGIKIIKLSSLRRNIHPISEIKALYQLYKIIKRGRYDLVHTHQSKAGMLGRLSARLVKVPVIVHTLHGPLFYPNQNRISWLVYKTLEKFSALYTNCFVSVGQDLKNYYLKNKIGKPETYSVIRSSIDLGKFQVEFGDWQVKEIKQEIGIKTDCPVIGMIGRLEKSKGTEQAVEVARKVIKKYPEVKFLFVGSGSLLSSLKKKVQEYGLENSIIFTGYRKDVEKVMAVFNILFLTGSLREGLPQSLIQGSLMLKPIVCFDIMGAKEMVKDNGFIVDYNDINGMVEKINYLLSDLNRAKIMGVKGKELVTNEWDIEEINRRNNELYDKLLSATQI